MQPDPLMTFRMRQIRRDDGSFDVGPFSDHAAPKHFRDTL